MRRRQKFFRFFDAARSRAGAALLVVLGFVVLLAMLTIGILKNAQDAQKLIHYC